MNKWKAVDSFDDLDVELKISSEVFADRYNKQLKLSIASHHTFLKISNQL